MNQVDAIAQFRQASELYQQGKNSEALEILTRLYRAFPRAPAVVHAFALLQVRLGNLDNAKRVAEYLRDELNDIRGAQLLAQMGIQGSTLTCPHCREAFEIHEHPPGEPAVCTKCGAAIAVPDRESFGVAGTPSWVDLPGDTMASNGLSSQDLGLDLLLPDVGLAPLPPKPEGKPKQRKTAKSRKPLEGFLGITTLHLSLALLGAALILGLMGKIVAVPLIYGGLVYLFWVRRGWRWVPHYVHHERARIGWAAQAYLLAPLALFLAPLLVFGNVEIPADRRTAGSLALLLLGSTLYMAFTILLVSCLCRAIKWGDENLGSMLDKKWEEDSRNMGNYGCAFSFLYGPAALIVVPLAMFVSHLTFKILILCIHPFAVFLGWMEDVLEEY